MNHTLLLALLFSAAVLPAFSQLPPANSSGVAMGHYHVVVAEADYDETRRLWIDGLGARPVMLGTYEVLLFPDTCVLLTKRESVGGSEGSTVNHMAFLVRDRDAMKKRWQSLGGETFTLEAGDPRLFLRFPGDVKVELSENKSLDVPIRHHHIHLFTDAVEEMRAWYGKMFGATLGTRAGFQAADLPGANLTFSPAETAPAGTKGRALDHIGFEVDNLEAFCRKLEADGIKLDRPYVYRPDLGAGLAFLTDPWGTYIELTEGLDNLR